MFFIVVWFWLFVFWDVVVCVGVLNWVIGVNLNVVIFVIVVVVVVFDICCFIFMIFFFIYNDLVILVYLKE